MGTALQGKVALVTGAARGLGRSHAVRFAQEGADVIVIDACRDFPTVPIPLATESDLDETVKLIEQEGRRAVRVVSDVRDSALMADEIAAAVSHLGRLDVIVANAGIGTVAAAVDMTDEVWAETIDINLTGVWNTVKAGLAHMLNAGNGGSIVLVSSDAGMRGVPNMIHYTAAKHGVVGLMRALAIELGPHRIRVNTVNPGTAGTDMVLNPVAYRLFRPDLDNPTQDDFKIPSQAMNLLPVPWLEKADVTNAVLFLASDTGRYITGTTLVVDMGMLAK
jgi:(+)-trans-carveol dehydrogenase